MTQHLSERDVRALAAYAHIGLADDELPGITADLNSIIENLQPILEYDLSDVEPTFHPIEGLTNVMREDEVQPSFSQERALANAPRQQDGCFLIPAILGGGDQ